MDVIADLADYASGGLSMLVGLAILGIGAGLVRRVHPGAGYALVAAGGVRFLTACCTFAADLALRSDAIGNEDLWQPYMWFSMLLALLELVVFWGAIAYAAYALVKKVSPPEPVRF